MNAHSQQTSLNRPVPICCKSIWTAYIVLFFVISINAFKITVVDNYFAWITNAIDSNIGVAFHLAVDFQAAFKRHILIENSINIIIFISCPFIFFGIPKQYPVCESLGIGMWVGTGSSSEGAMASALSAWALRVVHSSASCGCAPRWDIMSTITAQAKISTSSSPLSTSMP